MLSREHLLARVWGNRYEGGPRTVDIHVRRLRAKLGSALPLVTLRGAGYRLEAPQDPTDDPESEELPEASDGPAFESARPRSSPLSAPRVAR